MLSAFDGTSCLNEAAGVYAAITLSRLGKTAEAQNQLKSVLKKDNLSAPVRQWAEQLLQELAPKK